VKMKIKGKEVAIWGGLAVAVGVIVFALVNNKPASAKTLPKGPPPDMPDEVTAPGTSATVVVNGPSLLISSSGWKPGSNYGFSVNSDSSGKSHWGGGGGQMPDNGTISVGFPIPEGAPNGTYAVFISGTAGVTIRHFTL